MTDDATGDRARACCKVGRVAERYDVVDADRRLVDRHAEGKSLRTLERFLNVELLASALATASVDVVGDPESVYDTLTDDAASAGERTELRSRLVDAGVDVDALEADFVSYQSVRTHLRECLEVDTDRDTDLTVEDARGTIGWARRRSTGIVERTLERLAAADGVDAGDLDVSQEVRVTCRDCGVSRPVGGFLDRGGCECDATSD